MEAARLDSHTQETLSAPAVEAALALAERPEALLDKREELGEECQRAVKKLFDLAKRLEPKRFTPLPELLVEGFTLDQIWEQLALYNAPLLKYSQRRLRSHLAQPQDVDLPVPAESEEDEEDEDDAQAGAAVGSDSDDDPYSGFRSDGDEAESSDESDPEAAASKARRRLRRQDGAAAAAAGGAGGGKGPRRERKKRHAMENSFFSFDDMEKFMDEAEEEHMNEYNKDDEDEEEGKDGMGWSYE